MANYMEWTEDHERQYQEWLAEKSPQISDLARRFPPYKLYRLKTTGQRGPIISLSENGTVTIQVDGRFNRCLYSKNVFGINPDDLEECDLPMPDEPLGDECAERGLDPATTVIPLIKQKMIDDGYLPRKP